MSEIDLLMGCVRRHVARRRQPDARRGGGTLVAPAPSEPVAQELADAFAPVCLQVLRAVIEAPKKARNAPIPAAVANSTPGVGV